MVYFYTASAVGWGVSREVQPLWLIGRFSALLAMRLGKFPNKLRYFLSQIPVRRPFLPACFARLVYQLCIHDNVNRVSVVREHCFRHKLPLLFFSFVIGCRGGRFRLRRLFCLGLSDARFMGRILPEA